MLFIYYTKFDWFSFILFFFIIDAINNSIKYRFTLKKVCWSYRNDRWACTIVNDHIKCHHSLLIWTWKAALVFYSICISIIKIDFALFVLCMTKRRNGLGNFQDICKNIFLWKIYLKLTRIVGFEINSYLWKHSQHPVHFINGSSVTRKMYLSSWTQNKCS